ncbi:MAG TPA: hypothetical protein VH416_02790 [Gaiellaceae bacterium]|jgi:putative effector of murein hydrolase LrgA (UPF0299 family)
MNLHTFAIALALAAGLLALWILVRFETAGPRTVVAAFANVVLAILVLRLVVPTVMGAVQHRGLPADKFVAAFGVALPGFVYAFLSGAWTMRVFVRQLNSVR